MPFDGQPCERLQAVDIGYGAGVALQGCKLAGDECDYIGVYLCFDLQDALLGAQNLLFVLFQLLGNVAFGIGESLFAYPRLGHLVLVCVAHLDIVSEDVVVADLQRGDARKLAFAMLYLRQIVLAVQSYAAQIVQFGRYAVGDDAAFLYLVVLRVGIYVGCEPVAQPGQRLYTSGKVVQSVVVGRLHDRFKHLDRRERVLQLHQLARCNALRGNARGYAFEVADKRYVLANGIGQLGIVDQPLDDLLTSRNPLDVDQRHGYPAFQHAAAHCRERAVHHVGEAALVDRRVGRE